MTTTSAEPRKCPFCGGDLPDTVRLPIDDPTFDDVGHYIVVGDERRAPSRGVWLIILVLRKTFPHGASTWRLLEALPVMDHAVDRNEATLPFYILRARRVLAGTRYDIHTMRGFGYRLIMR